MAKTVEYKAFRKQWGIEYMELIAMAKAAKQEIKNANSEWDKHPTPANKHRFVLARSNKRAMKNVMYLHAKKLSDVHAVNRARIDAEALKLKMHELAGPLRPAKVISLEVMDKLERFKPIAIVLKREDRKLQGLIEHSFAMDWDKERVNIFWSGKAYSMLGEHMLNGPKAAQSNCRGSKEAVFDALSLECPVDIDWERWLAATNKFDKRNAYFTEKEMTS
jgi:hypothetical protein